MKNEQVVRQWVNNNKAKGGRIRTDGSSIYSYNQLIGVTADDGSKIVLDYTSPAGHYISQTTSTHVGVCKRYADQVMIPKVAQLGGLA